MDIARCIHVNDHLNCHVYVREWSLKGHFHKQTGKNNKWHRNVTYALGVERRKLVTCYERATHVQSLKKMRLPVDPVYFCCCCFLDLSEKVGPFYSRVVGPRVEKEGENLR